MQRVWGLGIECGNKSLEILSTLYQVEYGWRFSVNLGDSVNEEDQPMRLAFFTEFF